MDSIILKNDFKKEKYFKLLEERLNLEMRLQKLIMKKGKEKNRNLNKETPVNDKTYTEKEKKRKCLRILKEKLELEKRLQELILNKNSDEGGFGKRQIL